MIAIPPRPESIGTKTHDQFVVSHGKSGAVGVFTAPAPLKLRRGERVVIRTERGIEIGAVLCPASVQQARILGAQSSGPLLRLLTSEDQVLYQGLQALEQKIFETSRAWARRDGVHMEILDVEFLFDGQLAIVQFVGKESDGERFAQALQDHFNLGIRLENLAPQQDHEEEVEKGCDKPDCGRSAGGGCTSCSTGGGCSSCGSGKVDMRAYFGHLRDKMETHQRIPLA